MTKTDRDSFALLNLLRFFNLYVYIFVMEVKKNKERKRKSSIKTVQFLIIVNKEEKRKRLFAYQ